MPAALERGDHLRLRGAAGGKIARRRYGALHRPAAGDLGDLEILRHQMAAGAGQAASDEPAALDRETAAVDLAVELLDAEDAAGQAETRREVVDADRTGDQVQRLVFQGPIGLVQGREVDGLARPAFVGRPAIRRLAPRLA